MKSILTGYMYRTAVACALILLLFSALHFFSKSGIENQPGSDTALQPETDYLRSNDSGILPDSPSVSDLWTSWIKFFSVYLINLFLLYYGVQTLGVIRFIRYKQQRQSFLQDLRTRWHALMRSGGLTSGIVFFIRIINLFGFTLLKSVSMLILFTPAYVVAYTFKTNFNTDSFIFMIALGCLTNGILIMYAQKFYQLLVAEYRQGYVETAIANQHDRDFSVRPGSAVTWTSMLSVRKHFSNHVLEPVYLNARQRYLSSFREQASFLITCMIIIEMALNIHGQLGYELLQRLLFRDYSALAALFCGIYIILKLTELFTDYMILTEQKRHGNG